MKIRIRNQYNESIDSIEYSNVERIENGEKFATFSVIIAGKEIATFSRENGMCYDIIAEEKKATETAKEENKEEHKMLTHTALTDYTISRFEFLVDVDSLTTEQARKVEHMAYCANMGAGSNPEAWERFCYLVKKYINVDLLKLEADAEANGEKESMSHARRGEVSILTFNGKTRIITSLWCITFDNHDAAMEWLRGCGYRHKKI